VILSHPEVKPLEATWWEKSIGPLRLERAMKAQQVIMRAMAKRITRWQAGNLGVRTRTMRPLKRGWKAGFDALYDH
jgi:hypothetical protein